MTEEAQQEESSARLTIFGAGPRLWYFIIHTNGLFYLSFTAPAAAAGLWLGAALF